MGYQYGVAMREDAGGHSSWAWQCDGCGEYVTEDGWDPELEDKDHKGNEITLCDECAQEYLRDQAEKHGEPLEEAKE